MADGIVSPEDYQIQQMLAQAAALRKTPAPQGQMVSGIYVKPSMSQQLLPLVNSLFADYKENKAMDTYKGLQDQRTQELNQWLATRPTAQTVYGAGEEGPTMTKTEPTDADMGTWAAQGLKNPLSRSIAQASLQDNIVNAPIRQEKAQQRLDQITETNKRYDADREARRALQAERLASAYEIALMRSKDQSLNREQRQQFFDQANDLKVRLLEMTQSGQDRRNQANIDSRIEAAKIKANAAAGGKPLTDKQRKEMAEAGESLYKIQSLVDDFQDDYVGAKAATMNLLSPYGEIIPGFKADESDVKRIDWWKRWNEVSNVERHALFGSALTKTEMEAWKRQTITDTTDVNVVKAALQRRLDLAQRAMKRFPLIQAGGKLNQKTGEVEMPASAPASTLPRSTGASTRVTNQDELNQGQLQVLLSEAKSQSSVFSKEDYDSLVREIRRTGYKGEIPPYKGDGSAASAPAPAQKTGGWSIRRVE